jgi:hypothetical protein
MWYKGSFIVEVPKRSVKLKKDYKRQFKILIVFNIFATMMYYCVPNYRIEKKGLEKNPIIIRCCIKILLSPWPYYNFFINECQRNA